MQSIWAGNLGRCVQHFPTCWVVQETNIDLNHFVVLMEFLIIDQHWLRILLKSARQFSETLFKGNFLESDDFKGAFWAIFLSVFFNFSSKTILVPFEWSKKTLKRMESLAIIIWISFEMFAHIWSLWHAKVPGGGWKELTGNWKFNILSDKVLVRSTFFGSRMMFLTCKE